MAMAVRQNQTNTITLALSCMGNAVAEVIGTHPDLPTVQMTNQRTFGCFSSAGLDETRLACKTAIKLPAAQASASISMVRHILGPSAKGWPRGMGPWKPAPVSACKVVSAVAGCMAGVCDSTLTAPKQQVQQIVGCLAIQIFEKSS